MRLVLLLAMLGVWGCESGAVVCARPLEGEGAFGAVLEFDGELEPVRGDGRAIRWSVPTTIYFPEGRRTGAPVMLAGFTSQGLRTSASVIGRDGRSGIMEVESGGAPYTRVTGRLDGDGLDGSAWIFNPTTSWTGVADEHRGEGAFCPTGETPPAAELRPERIAGEPSPIGPVGHIVLLPTAPFDDLSALRVLTASGAEVPVNVDVIPDERIQVTAVDAFPPGEPLRVSAGGAVDVIGRPFALVGAVGPPLATSTTAPGLLPGEMLPDGSYANVGLPPGVTAEGLRFPGSSQVMIAFLGPEDATRLAATLSVDQPDIVDAAFVRPDGTRIDAERRAEGATTIVDIIPGETIWLALSVPPGLPLAPGTEGATYSGPSMSVVLESVVFE